ncbi:aspartate carbamoyltransferase regulatory subunit [Scatolibacter rhodanostii]|uniref:aspartate carbamoyltransferase regulatory subunit n=1 Tax=Scatolibacter rhodanostii TaxID=2014781 RepID=UPI000C06EFA4|nr:aspartate carbamoyltransferase regulatory subunit [Scatolibacter rhodanostii]
MLNIDSITNGIVIDHITAGKGMRIYELLELDKLDSGVAIIKNVKSNKYGKKDIIKIDSITGVNLDVLGFIDNRATVCTIQNGQLVEKKKLDLPDKLVNIVSCKNPRCITSIEASIEQVFYLCSAEDHRYRCQYCEEELTQE